VHSSPRDNVFLPADFVQTLEEAYVSSWREQELEGRFVELEGALFQRHWFETVENAPPDLRWHRYWDLAASIKTTADYTASAAVALGEDGVIYVRDMIHGKWEWPDAKRIIMQTMLAEPSTQHGIEEALHGLAAIQELRREPSVVNVALRGIHVDKDKISRALPWAARAEAGKVKLIRGNWIADFLDEACSFPHGKHDDIVDSLSGGIHMITKYKRKIFYE
jgi:predicted phage terminase large subunit-like protein